MTKYNGWTNWDTWNAHLWLTNDEWTYNKAKALIFIGNNVSYELRLLLLKLGNKDGIKFSNVNWSEIVQALKTEQF